MKRYPGMNVVRGMLLAPALLAAACGGEPSVASKSAAAYREAQAKGVPVGGGHDHGGHGAASATGGMDHSAHGAMDHSAHGTGANAHAGMDHGAGAAGAADHSGHATAGAADHGAMGHGTATNAHAGHGTTTPGGAVDHAAMGHGTAANAHAGHTAAASNAHAQHGRAPATGGAHAGHTATTGAATHDRHAGMQHGTTAPAADPHAQHGTPGTASAPAIASTPRSNPDMQRGQPAAITLRPDAFDAPAPASVSEAAKAAQGGGHEGHQMRGITPGQDRENPPSPMPATRDGSGGTAATPAAATVYTCPMHPEVTSDQPGTCPKCGMALVTKK